MSNPTTSNWKAVVNLMPIRPTPGGTLTVTGDVDTHSTDLALLKKAVPQGINPKTLLLDLEVSTGTKPVTNPQKVHYTEGLIQEKQYTSVEILYEGKTVGVIDNIEEIH
jgi:hypothetical protein